MNCDEAFDQMTLPGAHDHAGLNRCGAGCGGAATALDLDDAQAAGAEGIDAVGRAELRHRDASLFRGAHHRGAGWHRHVKAIDRQRDLLC